MEASSTVAARIERLRRSLREPRESTPRAEPASPATLDHRLLELHEKILGRTTEARRQVASATPRPDAAAPADATHEAPAARMADMRERLSATLANLPRLQKERLAESNADEAALQVDAVREIASFDALGAVAHHALRHLPPHAPRPLTQGLEDLVALLEDRLATFGRRTATLYRERNFARRLVPLHARIIDRRKLDAEALRRLAQELILHVDENGPLSPPVSATPPKEITPGERVANHAVATASLVAFAAARSAAWRGRRQQLVMAALLQDVGMLRLPPDLLFREGKVEPEELAVLQQHPHEPAVLLQRVEGFDAEIAQAAGEHHERLDGSGYPHGHRAEQLGDAARLLAVADSLAALCACRPYRGACDLRHGLTTILSEAEAGRLSPEWARMLLDLGFYPEGSLVELSTGELAEVIAAQAARLHPPLAASPVVRLLTTPNGDRLRHQPIRNLAHFQDQRVVRLVPASEVVQPPPEVAA